MDEAPPPPIKPTPVSLPGIHEIQGYFPGRLEFEHEIDNEAEDLVKDLEFGVCLEWGGDEIIEDENDLDVKARQRWEEERRNPQPLPPPPLSYDINGRIPGKGPAPMQGIVNGLVNGYHPTRPPSESGSVAARESVRPKSEDRDGANGIASGDEEEVEEVTQPPPIETKESLAFKLTLMEMYAQRVKKRLDGKAVILDRGLLEHKKVGILLLSSTITDSCIRCKLRTRSGPERSEIFYIDYDRSLSCKLRKIMRTFRTIFYVRITPSMTSQYI